MVIISIDGADVAYDATADVEIVSDVDGVVAAWIVGAASYTETPADITSLSESLSKTVYIVLTEGVSVSESITKDIDLVLSDTLSMSESLAKTLSVPLSETFTLTDAVVKSIELSITDGTTSSESLAGDIDIILADAVTIAESLAATLGISVSDAITIAESLVAVIVKTESLSDSVTISDVISTVMMSGPIGHKPRKDYIVKSAEEVEVQEVIEIERRVDDAIEDLFSQRNKVKEN